MVSTKNEPDGSLHGGGSGVTVLITPWTEQCAHNCAALLLFIFVSPLFAGEETALL